MNQEFSFAPLSPAELRWRCDPDRFKFATTADIEVRDEIVGQDTAIESLQFGLETEAPGQHVFVRGLVGTGRSTTIRRLLAKMKPEKSSTPDRCYVCNFQQPDRPRLLSLPRGRAKVFRRQIDELIEFIEEGLPKGLSTDLVNARIGAIEKAAAAKIEQASEPFQKELEQAGLALVVAQIGPLAQPAIVPVVEGRPASPEQIEALRSQGKLDEDQLLKAQEQIEVYADRLSEVTHAVQEIREGQSESIEKLVRSETRRLVDRAAESIRKEFPSPEVSAFLEELVEDLTVKRLHHLEQAEQFTAIYRVNVVLSHGCDDCPTILDNAPSFPGLLGSVDVPVSEDDRPPQPPHMLIRAGSILCADGGYLILEARDVLEESGAWKALIRTLKTGQIELTPPELPGPWRAPMLRPDPIPVQVKVVLLGDPGVYPLLESLDPDFAHLFKVLADFDNVIPRNDEGVHSYADVLARTAAEESLLPFDRTAVAALCEHGARIAARKDKLTARFGRLLDLAREAVFVARKRGAKQVSHEDVELAVRRTKRRAALPANRFADMVASGMIRIATAGTAVGQINGLAVMHTGPLSYGIPTRITATIGPGTAGAINIEREAELSGSIHTKGFYILGGLLRHLLRTEHPLAFDASVAFEQSYGGIDGDSASAAEICCLLSALTDVPLRQDLAMTGAIDQMGNILPIGAANEKIEGFYDACVATEVTGTQGVVIPASNAGDLMLRHDVVAACAEGRFAVYAVESIEQALGLFTGRIAGERDTNGSYPHGSLLGEAVRRAARFWERVGGKDH